VGKYPFEVPTHQRLLVGKRRVEGSQKGHWLLAKGKKISCSLKVEEPGPCPDGGERPSGLCQGKENLRRFLPKRFGKGSGPLGRQKSLGRASPSQRGKELLI